MRSTLLVKIQMELLLPSDYGYVILVAVAGVIVNQIFGVRVGIARNAYGVKPPDMYSDTKPMFNCIQRVHQNTLEQFPRFLMTLLVGGLQYPRLCALGGVIHLVGRFLYAYGYSSGDPAKRSYGAVGYIGGLLMLGCTATFGFSLVGLL
eukprot:m.307326 g.307326  ORF g.307326 m.307326 type:complete len:149 (+) comp42150_c0_seq1:3-449(+)